MYRSKPYIKKAISNDWAVTEQLLHEEKLSQKF